MIEVIKRSGEKEVFDEAKVRRSLKRSGANKTVEDKIVEKLIKKLYQGITTEKIYRLVFNWLKQEKVSLASKYNLKQAIIKLGPTGYPFELFLARLLEAYKFETKTSQVLSGKCVDHEVDVIAKTKGFDCLKQIDQPACYLIECKFHGVGGAKVVLKTALYVWARFWDLKEVKINYFGQEDVFNQGLLATNTKITSQALKYCQCMNLAVLSWDYPKGNTLPELIDKSHRHPLTCLNSLSTQDQQALLSQGLVFCQDLLDKTSWQKLLGNKSQKIVAEAKAMIVD
ncbi:MAG: ATP cone domain-containing protein [Candidatus Shapirobacteria bacterium]|nr:ATP cone domain-containing protein [Candidatus Shapirobacteria bacterium]